MNEKVNATLLHRLLLRLNKVYHLWEIISQIFRLRVRKKKKMYFYKYQIFIKFVFKRICTSCATFVGIKPAITFKRGGPVPFPLFFP